MDSKQKCRDAIAALKHAIKYEEKIAEDIFYFGGISKAFETAIEFSWKFFRAEAIEAGLDIPSPRDAIKQAGNLGIIDDVELWLELLKTRNIAVHNYLGIPKEEYLIQIKKFINLADKLKL